MTKATIGFAMCGSFCTFSKAFTQMQRLVDSGYDVIPIMSQNAFSTSTPVSYTHLTLPTN